MLLLDPYLLYLLLDPSSLTTWSGNSEDRILVLASCITPEPHSGSHCRIQDPAMSPRCVCEPSNSKSETHTIHTVHCNLTDYITVSNNFTSLLSLVFCPVPCMQFYIINTVLSAWKLMIVHSNQNHPFTSKAALDQLENSDKKLESLAELSNSDSWGNPSSNNESNDSDNSATEQISVFLI
ncbi:hypothetical protein AB205_0116510 [Aquarana catesbeiana]|uniref:Uncharacterized protein n=1 Tax=Aquarana catesbeiana TaxID=8400 RepID=A0A2G9QFA1_AQUCT|nr:hypothetical protein AB205_0116510 [Aquarana catesbeiana]